MYYNKQRQRKSRDKWQGGANHNRVSTLPPASFEVEDEVECINKRGIGNKERLEKENEDDRNHPQRNEREKKKEGITWVWCPKHFHLENVESNAI